MAFGTVLRWMWWRGGGTIQPDAGGRNVFVSVAALVGSQGLDDIGGSSMGLVPMGLMKKTVFMKSKLAANCP